MSDIINILLVGVGGQGTILAGKVLARAAVLWGRDVKFSEIHGMAQRGGSVVTQVRLGAQVPSPVIDPGTADFLLSFEQLEALRWAPMVRPGGLVLMSTQIIEPAPVLLGQAQYPTDIMEQLRARGPLVAVDAPALGAAAGNARTGNVGLLGCLARHLPLPRALWQQALDEVVPERHRAVNQRAFATGWETQPQGAQPPSAEPAAAPPTAEEA